MKIIACLNSVLGVCGFFLTTSPSLAADSEAPPERPMRLVEKELIIKTREVYEAEPKSAHKIAIFVRNTAGPEFNDKVPFFEDQVSALISGQGYGVISSDEVVKAWKVYRGSASGVRTRTTEIKGDASLSAEAATRSSVEQSAHGVAAVKTFPDQAAGSARVDTHGGAETTTQSSVRGSGDLAATGTRTEKWSEVRADPDRNTLGTASDQILADNTSALRLAQNMGADFLLVVSIGAFDEETQDTDNRVLKMTSTVSTLSGSYKVTEGFTGSSLAGGVFEATKSLRNTSSVKTKTTATVNQLIKDGAKQIAGGLIPKVDSFRPPASKSGIELAFAAVPCDLQGNEVSLPDIRLKTDGTVVDDGKTVPVQLVANIEIDGFGLGSTPASILVAPGAHKLRLTREDFNTYEANIMAKAGVAPFRVPMQMSDAGFRRWKEIRGELQKLDLKKLKAEAQAEAVRGYAQMLRQSGFMVNTTNAPVFNNYRSIYSMPPGP